MPKSQVRVRYDIDSLLRPHHQCTGGTGAPREDQGHSGLADAQECDRIEELLWVVHYYRWFVWGFSQLGAPLTDLTKHGAFIWT
jgi:hypothetical protein